MTNHDREMDPGELADLAHERDEARDLADEFENVAEALRLIASGVGTDFEANVLRGNIGGNGELIVSGHLDWDLLIQCRAFTTLPQPVLDAMATAREAGPLTVAEAEDIHPTRIDR